MPSSALDLTTKNSTGEKTTVASPILMPPPRYIPKCQPQLVKPKVVCLQILQKSLPRSEGAKHSSSSSIMKTSSKGSIEGLTVDSFTNNKAVSRTDQVQSSILVDANNTNLVTEKNEHRSGPINDIVCYINKNVTDIDSYTKNVICYQINKKIYSQPVKRVNMRVTPKKSDAVFERITQVKPKALRINFKHILKKRI